MLAHTNPPKKKREIDNLKIDKQSADPKSKYHPNNKKIQFLPNKQTKYNQTFAIEKP